MSRQLRDYNKEEQEGFFNLFSSKECKTDRLFEGIASKMHRHEYCLVGNDLVDQVIAWFENCGLKVRITDTSSYQTEIELI